MSGRANKEGEARHSSMTEVECGQTGNHEYHVFEVGRVIADIANIGASVD